MFPDLSKEFFQDILRNNKTVSIEDAVFRDNNFFLPENLKNHSPFWEEEILQDYPHKETILKWLQGVQIEEFLNSYTKGTFQGITLDSCYIYPAPQHFDNYVPEEFQQFMEENACARMGKSRSLKKMGRSQDPRGC